MITRLYIKDFILINELDLSLGDGFTTITGETGAGKSILVGAIGLILGNRADSKTVREGCKKAIIEADFDLQGIDSLEALFEENDLDYEPVCTLRRELMSTGKSRAFINDTPVTTALMKSVGEHLVDIHSQHHNMLIGDSIYQMSVLDTLAGNKELLQNYHKAFHKYVESKRRYRSEQKRIEEQRKEQEFLQFQYDQLLEADIREGELAQLEERQAIAENSTQIIEALRTVTDFSESYEGQEGVLEQIRNAGRQLSKVARHYAQVSELSQRMESLGVELNDLTREASTLLDGVDVDPIELERIKLRIDVLQGLLFKFKLSNSDELIELRDKYGKTLEEINDSDFHLTELKEAVESSLTAATELADSLSQSRKKAADALLPPLHELMSELGIAGATFRVQFQSQDELTELGGDAVQFLFATNKQTVLQPIREVASGGEISRFMLALKAILSDHTVLPTVIFDEIDTGVSGEIAEMLGKVMRRLGTNLQVLSITHLPQIAALSKTQLVVKKQETSDGYQTVIGEVKGDARIRQLATMLTGSEMTEAALANAKELLAHNQ